MYYYKFIITYYDINIHQIYIILIDGKSCNIDFIISCYARETNRESLYSGGWYATKWIFQSLVSAVTFSRVYVKVLPELFMKSFNNCP